ncbi:hypothetical protein BaRGS_00006149 [Batillaria attramentaria]|uniref:Uncharacterized protein n=1 Tax=Batillaria attramentaria TaxID=370345 RepID=A0ABD0LSN9_9CAEN
MTVDVAGTSRRPRTYVTTQRSQQSVSTTNPEYAGQPSSAAGENESGSTASTSHHSLPSVDLEDDEEDSLEVDLEDDEEDSLEDEL